MTSQALAHAATVPSPGSWADAGSRTRGLLVGASATAMLRDPEFVAAWQALAQQCPHATVFQSPAFVRTWYDVYGSRYAPVIAWSRAPSGSLAGLWLLAHDGERAALVHAGAHQAEYHVWLARPENAREFLAAAWRDLQALSFRTVAFKYLPHVSLADELNGIEEFRGRLLVTTHRRPLLRVDAAEVRESFAKKSNKSRFNRLKRLGTLQFARVAGSADFEGVFDPLALYYDFRQGAVNGNTPFRDDPLKREFCRRLFASAPDDAHLTVTLLNGTPIAGLWGMAAPHDLQLGIIAYSPTLAAHSPGKLHIMQLSALLLEEGRQALDLTPGGDAWKERFANAHDEVAEVVLHRRELDRKAHEMLDGGRRAARRALLSVGITPDHVRSALGAARRATPGAVIRKAARWADEQREFRVYRADRALADRYGYDPRIAQNSLADLLSFEPSDRWQSRQGFLASALARLEAGECVYTIALDGTLAHSGWMVRNQESALLTEVGAQLTLPPNSTTMYEYYTHPAYRGRGLYRATIGHMLRDAFADTSTAWAYISVLADNAPSRHVIESMGFEYLGSFHRHRRFGREYKSADEGLIGSSGRDE